jgi:hypothetical protein
MTLGSQVTGMAASCVSMSIIGSLGTSATVTVRIFSSSAGGAAVALGLVRVHAIGTAFCGMDLIKHLGGALAGC